VRQWIERRLGIDAANAALESATAGLAGASASSADRYDAALQRWLRLGAATIHDRLVPALAALGFDPDRVDDPADVLSGGERGRIGLVALELAAFDVLLLDEPTNDLDLAGIEHLERILAESAAPFVVVSHDRRLLERTVNAVVEIDPHTLSTTRFAGGWSAYLDERAIARAHEERAFDDYQQKKQDLEARARTERSWASKGANKAARFPRDNDKTVRHHAIETSENLAARARRTERAIERLDVVDKPWEPWRLHFDFGEVERSGDLVMELDQAVIERGSFRLGPLDAVVTAGERVHFAGRNGSGKTTLLLAMLGEVPLVSGRRRVGPSVTIGVLDQRRAFGGTPLDLLETQTNGTVQECRSTLAKFGLSADHVRRSASELSPGERTRALLAAFQLQGVNTVILDEPTNHLDLEAIEQLESALGRFRGTLLVVSHDRAFLDHLAIDRSLDMAAFAGA
jgi:ATPase subunit of ABC transporter with duplicated ATPase domains